MTNENATDDAQGSPDEPPSFRNTTPAVAPSALSPNGTQRHLESIPLSPRRQRIHRTHGSRSENSVSVPGSTPGLFPFHGVVPDWPQSSLQPFAMPLTPQTPHIGTAHAGSTVSQVVHPMYGIMDGFSVLPFGTSTNSLNIFSLLLTPIHFSYPAFTPVLCYIHASTDEW